MVQINNIDDLRRFLNEHLAPNGCIKRFYFKYADGTRSVRRIFKSRPTRKIYICKGNVGYDINRIDISRIKGISVVGSK